MFSIHRDLTDSGEIGLIMPQSTMMKMIAICKAERRKSLHGVDVTVADAMEVIFFMEKY